VDPRRPEPWRRRDLDALVVFFGCILRGGWEWAGSPIAARYPRSDVDPPRGASDSRPSIVVLLTELLTHC